MMSIDPDDDDEVAVGGIPNGNMQPRPFEPRQFEPRPFDPSRRSIMLDPETGLLGPGPDADASTPLRLPMVSNSININRLTSEVPLIIIFVLDALYGLFVIVLCALFFFA